MRPPAQNATARTTGGSVANQRSKLQAYLKRGHTQKLGGVQQKVIVISCANNIIKLVSNIMDLLGRKESFYHMIFKAMFALFQVQNISFPVGVSLLKFQKGL